MGWPWGGWALSLCSAPISLSPSRAHIVPASLSALGSWLPSPSISILLPLCPVSHHHLSSPLPSPAYLLPSLTPSPSLPLPLPPSLSQVSEFSLSLHFPCTLSHVSFKCLSHISVPSRPPALLPLMFLVCLSLCTPALSLVSRPPLLEVSPPSDVLLPLPTPLAQAGSQPWMVGWVVPWDV